MQKSDLEKTMPITPPPSRWQKVKRYLLRLFLIFFLLFFILAAVGFFYVKSFESRVNKGNAANASKFLTPRSSNMKELNILLVGEDTRKKTEKGRADTIILLTLKPKEKKAILISIPRDMRVEVPGYGRTKINHAYAYGSVPLLVKTVSEFLDVDIHHYVVTNFHGFRKIIDLLGGVDIYVEKRLYDPEHNIFIEAGWQHMDGAEALKYVRFRHDQKGDFGRIERQQKFFRAIFKKVARASSIWKIPSLVNSVAEYLETDMSVSQMVSLARTYLSLKEDDIQMTLLPGRPARIGGISYVLPEEEKISEIMYWVKEKGELPEFLKEDLKGVSVTVLNGCGKKGWATRVSSHMKSVLNVNVASIGDAENDNFMGTVIQFKPGNREAANAVKSWLGFGYLEEREDLNTDLVIILGKDSISKLEGRIS
jgi:LCP family protein required for cell wall assembly